MEQNLNLEALKLIKQQKRRRIWMKLLTCMACIVVFCTTYALILPAITKETNVFCGHEGHIHEDACYEEKLICGYDEAEIAPEASEHVHTLECYQTEKQLICQLSECEAHIHSEDCKACESILSCGVEESTGHTHGPECQVTESSLTCTLPEDETHTHGEGCYMETVSMVCGLEESEGHSHSDSCYTQTENIVCSFQETEGHTHSEDCYGMVEKLICESTVETEIESHAHTDACYKKALICDKEEHEHTLSCYSDSSADLETKAYWESTLPKELTGDYAEDVLAIAKSQLGYAESSRNYQVMEDGVTTKGYTRYGAWYGVPYGDWCAMFVSFCLSYAQVEDYPLDCYCPTWVSNLKNMGYFYTASESDPLPGDVIFFDWDSDGISDHVGLVAEFTPATEYAAAKIKTIEGNSADRVQYVDYLLSDPDILGFGLLPFNPEKSDDFSAINESGTQMYSHPRQLIYQDSSHKVVNSAGSKYTTSTYILVPNNENRDNWTPDILPWTANCGANYVVAYCADRDTLVSTGDDGEVYTAYRISETSYAGAAEGLSGIIGHCYPFITAEEMRQELVDAYNAGEVSIDLSCCVESEFIAAAQWAVWDMTGLSGMQVYATGSTFPDDDIVPIYPLTDVGHTNETTLNSHIKAIRDWLMTRTAPSDLEVQEHVSSVTRREDGTYDVETEVILNRTLETREEVLASFSAGELSESLTINEVGTDRFTVSLSGLTEAEVMAAEIRLEVTFEHMQIYVYDSPDDQDMISGQWGVDEYELSFGIEPETTSVDVTKHWANDEIGADYIEVQLYADGAAYGEPVRLSVENGWSYTWDPLLKYSGEGIPIEYTIREILIPGYYSEVTREEGGTRVVSSFDTASGFTEGGTYILTYSDTSGDNALAYSSGSGSGLYWERGVDLSDPENAPETALWTATGVSSDGTNAYLRNDASGRYLYYNGSYFTTSASASAKTYFLYNHLYLLSGTNNQYLIYLDGGVGYVTNIWDSALNVSMHRFTEVGVTTADVSYLINNQPTDEEISVAVKKEWAGRSDGAYPETAEVTLLQNGEPYGASVILSEENQWYYCWEELPLKVGDTEFSYTVEEVLIEDYEVTVENAPDENGVLVFNLTNTWAPEYVPLEISKVDAINTSMYLPGAQFNLYLAADEGQEGAELIPDTDNCWGVFQYDITIGNDGVFRIEELWIGQTYYLYESVAPAGYTRLKEPVVFTVGKDENSAPVMDIISGDLMASVTGIGDSGELLLQIRNEQGYVLPETGGTGKLPYTMGGLLLMATAALAFLMYYHKVHRREEMTLPDV